MPTHISDLRILAKEDRSTYRLNVVLRLREAEGYLPAHLERARSGALGDHLAHNLDIVNEVVVDT